MSIILTTVTVIVLLIPERRIIPVLSVSSIIILIGYYWILGHLYLPILYRLKAGVKERDIFAVSGT